jgi:hypothetical protein
MIGWKIEAAMLAGAGVRSNEDIMEADWILSKSCNVYIRPGLEDGRSR